MWRWRCRDGLLNESEFWAEVSQTGVDFLKEVSGPAYLLSKGLVRRGSRLFTSVRIWLARCLWSWSEDVSVAWRLRAGCGY